MIKYKKLIFFKGAYSTLDLFTDYLIRGFQQLGFNTMVFEITNMTDSLTKLVAYVSGGVDAMITINNLGFGMEFDKGHILWDQLHILCINILVDHPLCYRDAIIHRPIESLFLTIDRNHVKYLQRFYPGIHAEFMPHQGINIEDSPLKPLSERHTDVIYTGSLSIDICGPIMPDFTKYTDFDPEIMSREVIDFLIHNTSVTLEDGIEGWLVNHGLNYDDNKLADIISDFRYLECHVTSYYREKSIELLVNNGIDVEVYGRGWDKRPCFNNPHFKYKGLVSASDVIRNMHDSKIVLNTLTWFKNGAHERIYNAMLAKAVCVTETSIYLNETLHDGQDVVLFTLDDIDSLPDKVKYLLNNPDKAQAIANKGYELAANFYSTDCRVQQILSYLNH